MKKKRIDFRDLKGIMSKKEMMHVLGGSGFLDLLGSGSGDGDGTGSGDGTGTCGWYATQYGVTYYDCGVSKAVAQHMSSLGAPSGWCCDSCSETWYCGKG